MLAARGWGAGGVGSGQLRFAGDRVSLWDEEGPVNGWVVGCTTT